MKKILLLFMLFVFISVLSACQRETNSQTGTPRLNKDRSDALRLEHDYEGFNFIEDGIGEVELVNCLTGHSTEFREVGGSVVFRTRYLGVATPAPYTDPPQPWSLAVTDYVCFVLSNAERIVLQADPEAPRRDGTSWGRYLVYVWYDDGQGEFRNLNLELIEMAFTAYTGNSSLYGDIFRDAWFHAQSTNRGIWGEEDPDPRTGN